ncbi:MAG: beta/gamma crystallin-related protein [Chryseotalea sp.]
MAASYPHSYIKSIPSFLIKKLFILFVLLSSANEMCVAQNTKVTVYSDDFKGNEASFGVGQYDYMTLVKAGVSVIRSARVPEGMQITLYLDDQFKGKQLIITEDATQAFIMAKGFGNLHNNVSMAVSIAPVTKGPKVTIYKDNFSGESKSLAPGNYDYTDLGKVANDNISSISIPKGLKVTLFEHGGCAGRKLELKADASANDLVKNKFNDVTSSLRVEVVEEPTKEIVVEKPGVTKPVEKPVEEKLPEVVEPQIAVIIYQGNFSGNSNVLKPGKYNANDLGIGNEELSSIDIHSSLRVTLYEHGNFKGRTLQLTTRTSTERLTELGFNNITSSLLVEEIPTVSLYQGNFADFAFRLRPGKYDVVYLEQIGLLDNELSSIKIPPGMSVLLFDGPDFTGKALYLTQDANTDTLIAKKFNNLASSIQVNEEQVLEKPELKVTVYQDNFTGTSKQLRAGNYEHSDMGMANNTLSAINIPRGLRVTLYEYGAFEGKSLTLVKSAGVDLLNQFQFNDVVSSMKVEEINPADLVVTIYSDKFSGRGQQLAPGKYFARNLTIGDKQLSSVKVPKGMTATLYADWNCEGLSVILDRDEDFTGSKMFDNYYRSIVVEDITQPVVQGVPVVVTKPVEPEPVPTKPEEPVKEEIKESETTETSIVVDVPPCEFTDDEYADALQAVKAKAFSEEKMQMAKLVTKNKCLTLSQIRAIAQDFSFEEQTLEFVEYAYDLAKDKGTYYKLEDVFKFMSTQAKFKKFLEGK